LDLDHLIVEWKLKNKKENVHSFERKAMKLQRSSISIKVRREVFSRDLSGDVYSFKKLIDNRIEPFYVEIFKNLIIINMAGIKTGV